MSSAWCRNQLVSSSQVQKWSNSGDFLLNQKIDELLKILSSGLPAVFGQWTNHLTSLRLQIIGCPHTLYPAYQRWGGLYFFSISYHFKLNILIFSCSNNNCIWSSCHQYWKQFWDVYNCAQGSTIWLELNWKVWPYVKGRQVSVFKCDASSGERMPGVREETEYIAVDGASWTAGLALEGGVVNKWPALASGVAVGTCWRP